MADPVTLSKELKLHIPVIQFQNQELQYLSADLEYQDSDASAPLFKVVNYNFLSPDSLPPSLFKLATVTNGAAPEIVDIKNSEARLTFVSTIPLACAVIYGKTINFGQISTDSNMNGGAIINHNPILKNLEANTVYHYRVQGSDASGKIYWGPHSTFKTAGSTIDTNLLSLNNGARISAVSSNFGGSNDGAFGANSAIDGSNSTAWSSAGDGDDAFIEITLAESKNIDTIMVRSRSMTDGSAKILTFTITTDNSEIAGPFTLPNTTQGHQFPLKRTTKSVRLDVVTSTGGNTGVVEIVAYENDPSLTSSGM
ncbi:MAG: discoidin domain-containing protein [Methylococcales bacterium]|nr:discoidin domain-containing protein [Methylococcales bacterium]